MGEGNAFGYHISFNKRQPSVRHAFLGKYAFFCTFAPVSIQSPSLTPSNFPKIVTIQ
jgi:hypothetical protein